MKKDSIFIDWKNLFGEKGLSDFDKELTEGFVTDEDGQVYTPLDMSKVKIDDNFSFYDFLKSNNLLMDEDSEKGNIKLNWDLSIESQMKGASPFQRKGYLCDNKNLYVPIPKKSEIEGLLFSIEKHNRFELRNIIAYYKPFHFHENWGIYIFSDKIQYLTNYISSRIKGDYPHLTRAQVFDIVYCQTYFHELYHHKIEMLATKLEFALRQPVYVAKFYKFYCGTSGLDYCLEEAFAEVHGTLQCAKHLKKTLGLKESDTIDLIRKYLLKDTAKGYRVAYDILALKKNKIEELESQFIELLISYSYEELFGNSPKEIVPALYELFTYKLDPKINFKNKVTFLRPS